MDRGRVQLLVDVDASIAHQLDDIVVLIGEGMDRNSVAAQAIRRGLAALRAEADAEAARSVRSCPRCGAQLSGRTIGDILLRGCGGCGGIWLDHASARQLLATMDWTACRLAEMARDGAAVRPSTAAAVACPACQAPASRQGIDGQVQVDVCPRHGTWFDAGELAQVMHVRRAIQNRDISAPTSPSTLGEDFMQELWRLTEVAREGPFKPEPEG